MAEWFEQWFGEEYLRLYPHRDDEDARRAVRLVDEVAPLAGARVLDLACGPGRHVGPLVARGARVVGLDLSSSLLARARQRLGGDVPLVRGDMRRLPFGRDSFDIVVNLFTSFGYFSNDAEHLCVLKDVGWVLRPGGQFILDYLNASHVQAELVPREERELGTQRAVITRQLSEDARYVVKEMRFVDDGRRFIERVRLFTPDDLRQLLADADLHVRAQFGDYDGRPWRPEAPRTILVAAAA